MIIFSINPIVLTFVINALVRLTNEVTATNEGDIIEFIESYIESEVITPEAKTSEKNRDIIISSRRGLKSTTSGNPFITLDKDKYGDVYPARMDIGPNGHLYFTGRSDFRAYRVNGFADADPVVWAKIKNGKGITVGCEFDAFGNFYMVNGAGLYRVTYDKVSNYNLKLPHVAERFFKWTTDLEIPAGVGIDKNNHQAYVSDMGRGEIWKIDIKKGVGGLWASSLQFPGYEILRGHRDTTNFVGVPLGVNEVMVDAESTWLYFTSFEQNAFGRIGIQADGSAGELQILDIVEGQSALSGAFLDTRHNKLYAATPFTNFHNGLERSPNAKRGGEVWMLDLDDVNDSGVGGNAVMILQDLNYGTPIDVITGYGFFSENDLYILDGSFDTLRYSTGVVPDPSASYHAAIRVLTLTNCKKYSSKKKCKEAPGCMWQPLKCKKKDTGCQPTSSSSKKKVTKKGNCVKSIYDNKECGDFTTKALCKGSKYCLCNKKSKKCSQPKCSTLNQRWCKKLNRLCTWTGDICVSS